MRKYLLNVAASAVAIVAACSVFVHPYGDMKRRATAPLSLEAVTDSAAVASSISRACRNCHSESTEWPWYSYVAPLSWLIERDVHDGREHLNLSRWGGYTIENKRSALSKMSVMVRNGKMPLPQYLMLHPEAKLSHSDIDAISAWTLSERRRLQILSAGNPNTASSAPR